MPHRHPEKLLFFSFHSAEKFLSHERESHSIPLYRRYVGIVLSQMWVKETQLSTEYAIVVISAISAADVSRREYCTTMGVSDSIRIA